MSRALSTCLPVCFLRGGSRLFALPSPLAEDAPGGGHRPARPDALASEWLGQALTARPVRFDNRHSFPLSSCASPLAIDALAGRRCSPPPLPPGPHTAVYVQEGSPDARVVFHGLTVS